MALLLAAGVVTNLVRPAINTTLSGVFGSISMTAWICLLLPQLIQNYKTQSADGLSMAFLIVWLLGDIANLTGGLCTNLAPTAIALAVYFCIADVVLILQCLYYNAKNARRNKLARREPRRRSVDMPATEDEPLISRRRSSSVGLPGSHRRHLRRESESQLDSLTRIITGEDETPDSNPWLHNMLSLVAVYLVGIAGYFASAHIGLDLGSDSPGVDSPEDEGVVHTIGMILGYVSAVAYLCARIPQIVKNYREKSCEGLALLFFLLSLTGNLTYGASLIAYSQKGADIVKALPWLLGSLGTIVEDVVIFVQFRIYGEQSTQPKSASAAEDGVVGAAVNGHD